MRLRYLAAAPLVAVAMFGTTAAAWPSSTAAVPQAPPALTASALSDRYTAEARAIKTAERAAIRHRDSQLASALASLAYAKAKGATVRRDLIGVAARTARHGRGHLTVHLPAGWHREHEWMNLFTAACGPPAAAA